MIKVCFVRGKYLNNFEGQNYLFNRNKIQFTAVSSLFPLNLTFPFPVKKLPSLADIPFFGREVKYLSNRLLGDSQILFGLENLANKFDIFHTADPHYYYSYQLAKLRKRNLIKKLTVTSWETIPFNNESIFKKKQIKYFTLDQTDHFICHTKKAKIALIKEGVNERKISVINLGVDLNKFKHLTLNTKQKKDFTILFVGRLVEEKGIMDLYEVFKKIQNLKFKNQNIKLKLKIIGEGPLSSKIKYLVKSDGLGNLVSINRKNYEEMPEVYHKADIFILPSKKTNTWEEQYGMVLVEAMASGLPIIAYKTGAVSEVVGNAVILVKGEEEQGLFASIKRLIEMEELRVKLGRIGRERAKKEFDAQKTVKKITEIYKTIVNC